MNRYLKINTILITTLLAITNLFISQNSLQAQDTAYRIGPRDVLILTIYAGGEQQNLSSMTVSSEGMINVPFIGSVKAKGMTISQLEDVVTKPLAVDFFVNPEVNIVISEYHSLQYYISGAVSNSGLYEMKSRVTLLELIAKAGGASAQHASIAYIMRSKSDQTKSNKENQTLFSNNEPLKINLKKLLDKGDMSQNVELQSGDVVYIPFLSSQNLSTSKIYVEGEVRNPGVYTYQEGLTALNACIMAGGFKKFAAPNRTRIIRQEGDKRTIIKIDLNDVKNGKIVDAGIKPGDRIHIPETWF